LFVDTFNTADQKVDLSTGNGVDGNESITASGAVSFAQWHLVSASVNRTNGTADFFVDGALIQSSSAIVKDFANQTDLNLARFTNGTFYFNGTIDEARIEAGVRSSNWIWATYLNVASNATFTGSSVVTRIVPSLSILPLAAGLSLNWPASGVGFALYRATNLNPPVVWSPATNQPELVNARWQILLNSDNSETRFFRIQSQ